MSLTAEQLAQAWHDADVARRPPFDECPRTYRVGLIKHARKVVDLLADARDRNHEEE